ncbi:hypothetical protein ACFWPQ_01790 [Streptomyces sp. NPDC058464]|uniref:hypothetical protein n=1 Tax=Streptomyces sp. NPDC058464 TaxID=3346511 RepID=UPI00366355A1
MPRTAIWPSREEWAAKAEHATRTQCYTWQRVSTEPSDWLTPAELDEARTLAVAIVKATRAALTRAGRGNERPDLNAHGREAAQDWNDVNTLVFCWGQIARIARSVEAAPEKVERLTVLSTQMVAGRDKAAQEAEEKAVADAIATRNSDAGWAKELERRARFERGPQITTITVYEDGSSTVSEPQPYIEPRRR